MPRFRLFAIFLVFPLLLASPFAAHASNSVKSLPPVYRHWIEAEVPYIITSAERKEFLGLATNAQRDSFIDAFWRIRNPDPGSGVNSYKEEHYRRIAYANEHFGDPKYENGWRTDMGRMYIILGPPKQRAPYHALANIREMEIWFYQTDTPALPPYFYLLFYKPSAIESYKLYSPRMDGPAKLVSTGESRNDPDISLNILRKFAGAEVAKTAVTLLPNEAVNFDHFEPSMESDMLLATLNDLPDNPVNKERLEHNLLNEHVTMSVMLGDPNMSMGYEVFRDDQGREILSYLLSSSTPDPRLIGQRPDKSFYYDLTLRTSVLTMDGKSVYEQDEQLAGKLTEAQAAIAKKKKFAAEARLPLSPGKYTVVATLTNNINSIASRKHINVTVPAVTAKTIALSNLLAYKAPAAVPDPQGNLPFTASKLRFTPRGAQSVYLNEGERLPLVFQLWLDPEANPASEPDKIHLRYAFGAATTSGEGPTVEGEDVDAANRDKAGNLLTGHTLNTSGLAPGTYMLVVSANRVGTKQTAYSSMTLIVQSQTDFVDTWTAYGPTDPEGAALDDLKRGLSAETQGADTDAQSWYTKALAESSADLRPLDRLAALLERRGQTQELAALSRQPILARDAADPSTLMAIAQALKATGNPKAEVQLLEAQIKLQPPNADLYRTLADACEATGNKARARDLRSLAAGVEVEALRLYLADFEAARGLFRVARAAAGLAATFFAAFFAGAAFAPATAFLAAFFGLGAAFAGADLDFVAAFSRAARVLAASAAFNSASNSAGVSGRADLRSRSMS